MAGMPTIVETPTPGLPLAGTPTATVWSSTTQEVSQKFAKRQKINETDTKRK
jgi:hypothetical protein